MKIKQLFFKIRGLTLDEKMKKSCPLFLFRSKSKMKMNILIVTIYLWHPHIFDNTKYSMKSRMLKKVKGP